MRSLSKVIIVPYIGAIINCGKDKDGIKQIFAIADAKNYWEFKVRDVKALEYRRHDLGRKGHLQRLAGLIEVKEPQQKWKLRNDGVYVMRKNLAKKWVTVAWFLSKKDAKCAWNDDKDRYEIMVFSEKKYEWLKRLIKSLKVEKWVILMLGCKYCLGEGARFRDGGLEICQYCKGKSILKKYGGENE